MLLEHSCLLPVNTPSEGWQPYGCSSRFQVPGSKDNDTESYADVTTPLERTDGSNAQRPMSNVKKNLGNSKRGEGERVRCKAVTPWA